MCLFVTSSQSTKINNYGQNCVFPTLIPPMRSWQIKLHLQVTNYSALIFNTRISSSRCLTWTRPFLTKFCLVGFVIKRRKKGPFSVLHHFDLFCMPLPQVTVHTDQSFHDTSSFLLLAVTVFTVSVLTLSMQSKVITLKKVWVTSFANFKTEVYNKVKKNFKGLEADTILNT